MGAPEWIVPDVPDFVWSPRGGAGSSGLEVPDTHGEHHEHVEHRIHQGIDLVHFVETVHHIVHAGHAVAHGGAAAAGFAEMTPLGGVLVVAVTVMELNRAWHTTQTIQTEMGVSYGLMWEVLGVPDAEHNTRTDVVAGEVPLTDSEREAWQEGVREGRAIADKTVVIDGQQITVREAVTRAIAYEMAVQKKDPLTDPHQKAWNVAVDKTLNNIWSQVHVKSERWGERQMTAPPLPWVGPNGFPTAAGTH